MDHGSQRRSPRWRSGGLARSSDQRPSLVCVEPACRHCRRGRCRGIRDGTPGRGWTRRRGAGRVRGRICHGGDRRLIRVACARYTDIRAVPVGHESVRSGDDPVIHESVYRVGCLCQFAEWVTWSAHLRHSVILCGRFRWITRREKVYAVSAPLVVVAGSHVSDALLIDRSGRS